jgi:hypothetical protein
LQKPFFNFKKIMQFSPFFTKSEGHPRAKCYSAANFLGKLATRLPVKEKIGPASPRARMEGVGKSKREKNQVRIVLRRKKLKFSVQPQTS